MGVFASLGWNAPRLWQAETDDFEEKYMGTLLRRSLAVAASAGLLLGSSALADTIHMKNGSSIECTVERETYEKVYYKLSNLNVTDLQNQNLADVEKIDYARIPETYQEGRKLQSEGSFGDAIDAYKEYVGKGKDEPFVQYALYYIAQCYQSAGKYKEAIDAYDDLLKQVPKTRFYPQAYLAKANCYQVLGDAASAKKQYQQLKSDASKFGPRWEAEANFYLTVLDESKDYEAAIKKYREMMATRQDEGVAQKAELQIGLVLVAQNKLDEALEHFRKITEREGASASILAGAWVGMARCYLEKPKASEQDYKEARFAALRTVILYPEATEYLPAALYYAGRAFELVHDTNWRGRAKQLYDRVMSDFPASEWAAKAKERAR